MKAIICDKCKKVMSDELDLSYVKTIDFSYPLVGHYFSINLCTECKKSFDKIFTDWMQNI